MTLTLCHVNTLPFGIKVPLIWSERLDLICNLPQSTDKGLLSRSVWRPRFKGGMIHALCVRGKRSDTHCGVGATFDDATHKLFRLCFAMRIDGWKGCFAEGGKGRRRSVSPSLSNLVRQPAFIKATSRRGCVAGAAACLPAWPPAVELSVENV